MNDLHLIILGKINSPEFNKLGISHTEISKNFFGQSEDLIEIYSSVDLVVMPSLIEAFGQVALEAAACNVPTVGFGNTGIQEIIIHKKNGYIAEFKNSEDLYEGIKWCLEDKNLGYLKKECRKIAKKSFNNTHIVNKYRELYENLI